jgi:hypothetical protein
MKNLLSVLPILSAVHSAVETPSASGITDPEHADTDVLSVYDHSPDRIDNP